MFRLRKIGVYLLFCARWRRVLVAFKIDQNWNRFVFLLLFLSYGWCIVWRISGIDAFFSGTFLLHKTMFWCPIVCESISFHFFINISIFFSIWLFHSTIHSFIIAVRFSHCICLWLSVNAPNPIIIIIIIIIIRYLCVYMRKILSQQTIVRGRCEKIAEASKQSLVYYDITLAILNVSECLWMQRNNRIDSSKKI